MTITRRLAAGFGLLLLASTPTLAQQTPPPSAATEAQSAPAADQDATPGRGRQGRGALAACRADLQAHCAGVERGRRNRIACLEANETKLSPDCSTALQSAQDHAGGRRRERASGDGGGRGRGGGRLAACQADIATHCASVEKRGRMRCLRDNQTKLSPDCASSIQSLREGRKMLRQACATERETLCAKPAEGGGGLAGCLRQNADRLSPGCSTALASLPERGRGRQAQRQ